MAWVTRSSAAGSTTRSDGGPRTSRRPPMSWACTAADRPSTPTSTWATCGRTCSPTRCAARCAGRASRSGTSSTSPTSGTPSPTPTPARTSSRSPRRRSAGRSRRSRSSTRRTGSTTLAALNVQPADVYPRASDYVEQMIEFAARLEELGLHLPAAVRPVLRHLQVAGLRHARPA